MNKALVLLAALFAGGCNLKYHSIPDSGIVMAHADYQVLGATSAEACGTYIFGIDFGHLFTDSQGAASAGAGSGIGAILGLLGVGAPSPEAARALYDAIEKMPDATNLYAPKIHTTVTGISPFGTPIFGQRCASVEAHGVKLGRGPVPNAN